MGGMQTGGRRRVRPSTSTSGAAPAPPSLPVASTLAEPPRCCPPRRGPADPLGCCGWPSRPRSPDAAPAACVAPAAVQAPVPRSLVAPQRHILQPRPPPQSATGPGAASGRSATPRAALPSRGPRGAAPATLGRLSGKGGRVRPRRHARPSRSRAGRAWTRRA